MTNQLIPYCDPDYNRIIILYLRSEELSEEVKLTICDLTRKIKPDIVITHWKGSFHRDHRNCYELVMEGTFYAALPGIKRELPAPQITALYAGLRRQQGAVLLHEPEGCLRDHDPDRR